MKTAGYMIAIPLLMLSVSVPSYAEEYTTITYKGQAYKAQCISKTLCSNAATRPTTGPESTYCKDPTPVYADCAQFNNQMTVKNGAWYYNNEACDSNLPMGKWGIFKFVRQNYTNTWLCIARGVPLPK